MITFPAASQIWIAAGVTDMRRSLNGLGALVQTTLEANPFNGHIFVFRGRRGDLIKVFWFDGDGLWKQPMLAVGIGRGKLRANEVK